MIDSKLNDSNEHKEKQKKLFALKIDFLVKWEKIQFLYVHQSCSWDCGLWHCTTCKFNITYHFSITLNMVLSKQNELLAIKSYRCGICMFYNFAQHINVWSLLISPEKQFLCKEKLTTLMRFFRFHICRSCFLKSRLFPVNQLILFKIFNWFSICSNPITWVIIDGADR